MRFIENEEMFVQTSARISFLGALLLLLSACCCIETKLPSATNPLVFLLPAGSGLQLSPIAVTPDPLVYAADQKEVKIAWQLTSTSDLKFPGNGIVIANPAGEVDCGAASVAGPEGQTGEPGSGDNAATGSQSGLGRSPDGQTFTCLDHHTRPGTYKYTISVLRQTGTAGQPVLLTPLDPTIVNK